MHLLQSHVIPMYAGIQGIPLHSGFLIHKMKIVVVSGWSLVLLTLCAQRSTNYKHLVYLYLRII